MQLYCGKVKSAYFSFTTNAGLWRLLMRGFPPIHLLFFCVLFGLIAWPLSQLTFARRVVPAPAMKIEDTDKHELTPGYLYLRLSHLPKEILIRPLHPANASALFEKLETSNAEIQNSMELPMEMALDSQAIELSIEATWPDETPDAAITIELEPDGLEKKTQTVWSSNQQLSEILTFQWQP